MKEPRWLLPGKAAADADMLGRLRMTDPQRATTSQKLRCWILHLFAY
jgi:hypothetical protein